MELDVKLVLVISVNGVKMVEVSVKVVEGPEIKN